ncbi:hypothetical protein Scep_029066 [Stephania cephalantha]|uniref:Pentatricopeptide repeat-containing protein n=1 Tax=Stephania cephalantha TaxID=152367 RepID=A0AAP0DZX5_9MAGN
MGTNPPHPIPITNPLRSQLRRSDHQSPDQPPPLRPIPHLDSHPPIPTTIPQLLLRPLRPPRPIQRFQGRPFAPPITSPPIRPQVSIFGVSDSVPVPGRPCRRSPRRVLQIELDWSDPFGFCLQFSPNWCDSRSKIRSFWGLYREMIEYGLIGDAETAGYLIRAFCRDGKVDEAYELLRQVLDSGVVVTDSVAYTKLISGFCKLRNYDRVSEILHVMIAKNCAPNVFTYQEIIHGLCRNGKGDEGFRVFGDLKRRGYAPDLVMYTTMIDGLCKMGRIGDARRLWFELIRNGFLPNEYTYNVFIDGNFKHGNVGEAKRLYEEMCGREGFRLSVLNCNTMISGFCLNGRMDEACEVFEEMVERGMEPDVITYNTLIQGFCKVGKTVEAVNMYGKLIEKGLQPSPATYTPMIQVLCDNGEVEEAIGLWNDMQCRGVEPLVCTRDYIINGLCKQGNAVVGMEWMVSMLQNKLRPLRKTFDGLIECLASKGLLDDALLALQYMFGMGYVLEEPTLNSLLGQLCKDDSLRASKHLEGILDGN